MKIEHIALYVNDLEGGKTFFEHYFHATSGALYHNRMTDFRSYFLSFDDGSRLELMSKPDLYDSGDLLNRYGYAHIAFSLGSPEEVDRMTALLAASGYRVLSGPRTTGDGYYESCILGFEGSIIELTV